MIVTCDECSTSFQLDESRIPESGARVRCSKCKHAFFLPNPSASGTDAVHSIAEEASRDEITGVPPATADLAGLDGSIASEANPPEPEPDLEDEEDWQFTEKVRTEGDDDLATEDDFGVGTDFSEGIDEASLSDEMVEAEGELDLAADPGVMSISDEGIDFGAEMDASGLDLEAVDDIDAESGAGVGLAVDEDDVDVGDETTGIEAGHDDSSFGDVKDFSELTEDIGNEAVAEAESVLDPDLDDDSDAGLYSATGSTEDLGDPENWDLAPDADFNTPRASIAGLVDAFSPGTADASNQGAGFGFEGGIDPADFDAEIGEASRLVAVSKTVATGLGWLGTIAVVCVVAYLSVLPEWQRGAEGTQIYSAGEFVAETTDTRWIDTTRSGSLLVIDGVARNTGREVIWPPSLQVVLLDAAGNEISGAEVGVGVPLPEVVLREGTFADLSESKKLAPERFRTSPLGPGEMRAFQAVIGDLPEAARRVVLEAVERGDADDFAAANDTEVSNPIEVDVDRDATADSVAGIATGGSH